MNKMLIACLAGGLLGMPVAAQVAESRDDLYGLALPYPLVHLVHSRDAGKAGTTAHLMAEDPFLLYTLGRDLIRRQYGFEHGAFGQTGDASIPLYAGGVGQSGVPRFARDHANSCGGCHSMPHPEPGAGQTIASTGGMGRNTPHFFGAGLIEMIGEEVRRSLMARYDLNENGWIDRAEVAAPAPALVAPVPGGPEVSYGDLAPDAFGVPQLNSVFRVWYVDATGRVLNEAMGLDDPAVAGFGFVMQPFGWGRGDRRLEDGRRMAQGAEASSVRQFFVAASDLHMGMEAQDASLIAPFGQRLAGRSLSGAMQVDFGDVVDRGTAHDARGLSLDDPDGDGARAELSEGDADAAEFYMLHVPPPAVDPLPDYERGKALFSQVGCGTCHVQNWLLPAGDPVKGTGGDRRVFDLALRSGSAGPEGRLIDLTVGSGAARRGAVSVAGVYSDFKHWDLGPGFEEVRYDGTVQRTHRTAPLWGVGSTAPFGHSGQYMTLHAAIAAHGGAAQGARDGYLALASEERAAVVDFLRSLVLYVSDELPTDLDGDGIIAGDFVVNGQGMGYERFDPRFLMRTPPQFREIARVSDHEGRSVPLTILENADALYGLTLPYRRDTDGDGVPDILADGEILTGAGQ
ncbi:di-heme oxidoredictase family protein [Primorskyibacter sp. 2E107]|uniref:di-heme oxidoredictase family protein n=1 Tax=Primorskyibacter sp. 2E107 TaxID=3403458 RepID=UPI003AF46403